MVLDGRWHYIVDPYETGFRGFQGATADETGKLGGFFEDSHQRSPSDLVEYDFDKSPSLDVPGDWNSQNDQLLYYEGSIWYEREFEFHPRQGKRYFLRFNAVNYEAYVSMNDQKLGVHTGGFTPFAFEVTGILHDGMNFIVLKVNNTRKKEAVPTDNFDWWNYGGITGSVMLVETPSVYIRDYRLQLARDDPHRMEGQVWLDGAGAGSKITIRIPEAGLQKQLSADHEGYVAFSMPVSGLQYWSPDHPKRYEVLITTEADTIRDRIGFRTIQAKGSRILLNGIPIFLRGIALHDEDPFIPGRPRSEADCRMLLLWAKELHCNFIRMAHYPHNELESRLADSLGLLLWEEVPVYWTIDWTNGATLKNAEQQLTEMIQRDKNRASVIIWSVGNETPNTAVRERFMEAMADSAHALDSGRLVSAALLTRTNGDSVFVDDPLGRKLDVVSFNEYYGWYGNDRPWQINRYHVSIPYRKPVLISELGAGALAGFHGDSTTRFSEEYQASFYRNQLDFVQRVPNLVGMTPWVLVDFRSPKRLHPEFQDGWNRKGLLSETGQKKSAFYILRDFYIKMEHAEPSGH